MRHAVLKRYSAQPIEQKKGGSQSLGIVGLVWSSVDLFHKK